MDESFDPQALLAEAKGQKVILNLKGVTRLSSFGVREWTNAMRELCGRVEHVYFVEVSPAVVTQLNMVANFAGAAHVLSVQAPFYCDCGFEMEVTYDLRDGTVNLNPIRCRECGSQMSFDDDPEAYFSYPLENARSKPMDPNIDVFLRHLSEGMQEEGGGMRSFPPPAVHEGTSPGLSHLSSDLSIPGRTMPPRPGGSSPGTPVPRTQTGSTSIGVLPFADDPPTMMQKHRRAGAWVRMKSVLLGLSIPAVLAAAIVALWPSGGSGSGLSGESKREYQEHVENGRHGEAMMLLRRLERQQKIAPEDKSRLSDELKSLCLTQYPEHLDNERFADAARMVTNCLRDRVIAARDGTRLHKEVLERALARHRELLLVHKISEAEEVAESLSAHEVLPMALRRSFQNDVALDRQQLQQSLEGKVQDAYESQTWQDVVDDSDVLLRIGPPVPKVDFYRAEALRKLEMKEPAAKAYADFIDKVQNENPKPDGFDDALYQRAKLLEQLGRRDEARGLYKRLVEMPGSKYKDEAGRELR